MPVPSRARPSVSCAPSAPSPEVAAASDMSHSLARLPLFAPAALALQPSSTCKDRKGPAPFHISSEPQGGDPAFLPAFPFSSGVTGSGHRDPGGMWRERTPSCFLQRETPGRRQPCKGPFAPPRVGSKEGDPCNPVHPKSTLLGDSKISFLSPSPCLTALGSIVPSHPPIEAMLGAGAPCCWGLGYPMRAPTCCAPGGD